MKLNPKIKPKSNSTFERDFQISVYGLIHTLDLQIGKKKKERERERKEDQRKIVAGQKLFNPLSTTSMKKSMKLFGKLNHLASSDGKRWRWTVVDQRGSLGGGDGLWYVVCGVRRISWLGSVGSVGVIYNQLRRQCSSHTKSHCHPPSPYSSYSLNKPLQSPSLLSDHTAAVPLFSDQSLFRKNILRDFGFSAKKLREERGIELDVNEVGWNLFYLFSFLINTNNL